MNEGFDEPLINIDEFSLYPEMDKKIASLLMIRNNDILSMYAAKLIRKYQAARCRTCKYHNEYSYCTNQKLTDERSEPPDMEIGIDEGGDIFTGDKFGCIHHAGKEKDKC